MLSTIRNQFTIKTPARVFGFGFWSGRDVCLEFRPGQVNSGVRFVRRDLPGHPVIPANVLHRVQGPRRTTLVHNGCAVEMVEHVLAALSGMEIDNCEVWIDRPEMPGCDGSSQPFVDALQRAGRQEQSVPRQRLVVQHSVRVEENGCWIEAEPSESGQLELCYNLLYSDRIPKQTFSAIKQRETFEQDICSARTFLLKEEAETLQSQGLGRRVNFTDLLVFDDSGPIANSLKFTNECARHKLLDMIGDFALLGQDIIGKITAHRSGHYLNSKLVLALMQSHPNSSLRKSA